LRQPSSQGAYSRFKQDEDTLPPTPSTLTPGPSPKGRGELGIVLRTAGASATALRSNNDAEKRFIAI